MIQAHKGEAATQSLKLSSEKCREQIDRLEQQLQEANDALVELRQNSYAAGVACGQGATITLVDTGRLGRPGCSPRADQFLGTTEHSAGLILPWRWRKGARAARSSHAQRAVPCPRPNGRYPAWPSRHPRPLCAWTPCVACRARRWSKARLEEFAYEDGPLPIGEDQTISQPYIVALMIEAAEVKPGDRVLEVGAGSGYAAAVLEPDRRCGSTRSSVIPSLAERAREHLSKLGYDNIELSRG